MVENKNYEVCFYETARGDCPADDFIGHLNFKTKVKLEKWLAKLEELGPDLPRPYADVVRGKIRELRLIFASNQYRLFYFFRDKKIIVTHGFMKKTDKIPKEEILRAERIRFDFEERLLRGEIEL